MFIPFDLISPLSRVWIYQASRSLTATEKERIAIYLKEFTENWAAHGQPLKSSFQIAHDRFVIIAADESQAMPSGCSIDASVRVIKEIENVLDIQLSDRNLVAFKNADGIALVALKELKEKYAEGTWNEGTLTFNNLVSVKGQLEAEWIVPAGNTWLKRYVAGIKVAL
jgi:hypothetical protein